MTDHFGNVGEGGSGGGLSTGDVNGLIAAASIFNVTCEEADSILNTYAVPTFKDSTGRGVKRSRIYQDDSLNAGRVTFNQPAESVQLPETRGQAGYALTMHRDPLLAAQGRTEWYSEAVVVPDDLQVSSISSLNPGVIPLEIKTAVSFTGGQVVDFATSDCTNVGILDAVDLKATGSLETSLVKSTTGNLQLENTGGVVNVQGRFGTLVSSAIGPARVVGSSSAEIKTADCGVSLDQGVGTINVYAPNEIVLNTLGTNFLSTPTQFITNGGSNVVNFGAATLDNVTAINTELLNTPAVQNLLGDLTLVGSDGIDLSVVVGASTNKALEISKTSSAVFNGNLQCKNGFLGIQAGTLGAETTLNFSNSNTTARGNLTANDTAVIFEAKDQRLVKFISDDSEYLVIDPGTVATPFTVTVGLPGTLNSIPGALIVGEGVSTLGTVDAGILQTDLVNSTGDLKIIADNTMTLALDNSGEDPIMVVALTGITSFKKQVNINSGLLNVTAPEPIEVSKFRLLDFDNKQRSTYEATDSRVYLRVHDDRVFQLFKDNTTSYLNVDPANQLSTYAVDLGVTAQDTRINGLNVAIEAPTKLNINTPLTEITGDLKAGNINCTSINLIKPSGGVYSESSDFKVVGASGGPINLLGNGLNYGTLTVPANAFQPGDAYQIKVGGKIICNNNANFQLSLDSDAGSIFWLLNATIDAQASPGQFFEIEVEFIIRAIGGEGVAAISTNGHFSYFSSTQVMKGYGQDEVQMSTFDTTVPNTIRLRYVNVDPNTTISLSQVQLTKTF